MAEGVRNPEIQRLLARLRGIDHDDNSSAVSEAQNGRLDDGHATSGIPGLSHPASSSLPPLPLPLPLPLPQPSSHTGQASGRSIQQVKSATGIRRDQSVTPTVPDASQITTWPAALKHVTKHIMPSEQCTSRIKHMISEQHKHERQWWAGREAILARQSGRQDNQQKAADLLKSLGGFVAPVTAPDPAAYQAELEAYDKKVYRGLTAMVADFDRQLRGMGVPFYCIKHELVILEDGKEQGNNTQKNRIDRGELREMQKKMLQTLEDLFGDSD